MLTHHLHYLPSHQQLHQPQLLHFPRHRHHFQLDFPLSLGWLLPLSAGKVMQTGPSQLLETVTEISSLLHLYWVKETLKVIWISISLVNEISVGSATYGLGDDAWVILSGNGCVSENGFCKNMDNKVSLTRKQVQDTKKDR